MLLKCPKCGMSISGADSDMVLLQSRIDKHVAEEHGSVVDKHVAVLSYCYAALKTIASGGKLSKAEARHACEQISELIPQLKGQKDAISTLGTTASGKTVPSNKDAVSDESSADDSVASATGSDATD